MGDNSVFVNKQDLVEIIVRGNQTVASVQYMGDEALRLCLKQREMGKRALILDNLLQMRTVPTAARQRVVDLVKSSDYDKLAMVGNNPVVRLGSNLMLRATGKGKRVRYFEDYDEAIVWLKR
jgi:hypothetical protein